MNGCSFQQVLRQSFGLVFVWVFGYLVLRDFILKPTERAYILLNMVLGIFKIALCLRNQHVFMRQSVEILNDFKTLTLKQIFWKMKTFLKTLSTGF